MRFKQVLSMLLSALKENKVYLPWEDIISFCKCFKHCSKSKVQLEIQKLIFILTKERIEWQRIRPIVEKEFLDANIKSPVRVYLTIKELAGKGLTNDEIKKEVKRFVFDFQILREFRAVRNASSLGDSKRNSRESTFVNN